jgi:hypothetical protein
MFEDYSFDDSQLSHIALTFKDVLHLVLGWKIGSGSPASLWLVTTGRCRALLLLLR